ncbi:MAG TPA: NADH-quinone oxidoreductase subunit A [Terriglobales bacterium]|nr:NADH-quinone oxidoreductase subunit A [Terriglobales bacterium]
MPHNYFARYIPLLLQMLVAGAMAIAIVVMSSLIGKHKYARQKFQPYECGITPTGGTQERFSVKFYLVAMLFILFDVEAVFLYPWAVILRELKMFGFWEMFIYIVIVMSGLFYVWKKGVLDWNPPVAAPTTGISATPDFMPARFESAVRNVSANTRPDSQEVTAVGGSRS